MDDEKQQETTFENSKEIELTESYEEETLNVTELSMETLHDKPHTTKQSTMQSDTNDFDDKPTEIPEIIELNDAVPSDADSKINPETDDVNQNNSIPEIPNLELDDDFPANENTAHFIITKLLFSIQYQWAFALLPILYYFPKFTIWSFFSFCAFILGILFKEAVVDHNGGFGLVEQHYKDRLSYLKPSTEKIPVAVSQLSHSDEEIDPELNEELNKFISYIIRDFIDSWYVNLNTSKSRDFSDSVHFTIHEAFLTLGFAGSKINHTDLLLSIMHVIILHVREYKAFDATGLDMQDYLIKFKNSRFRKFASREMIIENLCNQSMKLSLLLLPRADKNSPAVFAIVREILATKVLLPLIDKVTDPNWLNETLLNTLRKPLKSKSKELTVKEKEENGNTQIPIEVSEKLISVREHLEDSNGFAEFCEFAAVTSVFPLVDAFMLIGEFKKSISNNTDFSEKQYQLQQITDLVSLFSSENNSLEKFSDLIKLDLTNESLNNSLESLQLEIIRFLAENYWDQYLASKEDVVVGKSRLELLQDSLLIYKKKMKEIALKLAIAEDEEMYDLMNDKFLYQSVIEDLQDFIAQENEEPSESSMISLEQGVDVMVLLNSTDDSENLLSSFGLTNVPGQYLITVNNGTSHPWAITKLSKDFYDLELQVSKNLSRLAGKVPAKPIPKSFAPFTDTKALMEERIELAKSFTVWLNDLLKDPVGLYFLPLVQFLQPEQKEVVNSLWRSASDTFSSAGAVFKRVSVTANPTTEQTELNENEQSIDLISPDEDISPTEKPGRRGSNTHEETFSVTHKELQIVLDVAFSAIEELFSLGQPDQWIRQQSLHLIKTVLKNTFGSMIRGTLQSSLDAASSQEAVKETLKSLSNTLWPNGMVWGTGPPPIVKSAHENARIKHQLFCLLTNQEGIKRSKEFSTIVKNLQTLVGSTNTKKGLIRGFSMVQNQLLSAGLFCDIIECIIDMVTSPSADE
ncbi:PXA domain-containing protein [Globomyces pollinis-pini]|nr:PXA domain-containing protein [Globomyces pollinis-pini]